MLVVLASMSSAHAAAPCTPEIAKILSIQGVVELRRSVDGRLQEAGWQAAELNVALCPGDMVRTHERSRAALLLSNETTLRLDQRTTLTLAAPDSDKASLMDLFTGALHVITRTSRPFRVRTPFVNANVEGTEFLVTVGAESGSVAVYEGRVTADNERGSVVVASGELAIAARNSAPRKEIMVRPSDAVQWALYFPTVFDYRLGAGIAGAPGEAALQESIALYRKGRLTEAIARLENVPEGMRNPRFLTYRSGLLLLVGRLDEAKPEIERALALDPRNSDAYSLQAIIAVVENYPDEAVRLADKAVELDPASTAARIALSYARQAQFKVEEALATARKAVELDPQNGLAWARVAELEMSTGNLNHALEAAKRAAGLNPGLAKTQTVLGSNWTAPTRCRGSGSALQPFARGIFREVASRSRSRPAWTRAMRSSGATRARRITKRSATSWRRRKLPKPRNSILPIRRRGSTTRSASRPRTARWKRWRTWKDRSHSTTSGPSTDRGSCSIRTRRRGA